MTTTAKPKQSATPAVQEQGTGGGATAALQLPALGEQVVVQDPQGVLINLETGARFAAGEPTPQVVTVHTLRRLEDGCLLLVA